MGALLFREFTEPVRMRNRVERFLVVDMLDFLLDKVLYCELTAHTKAWKLFLTFFCPRRHNQRYMIQAILFQTNDLNILTC